VITRYLAAESSARENGTIAITPANYKFRYMGKLVQHGVTTQILEVTPGRRRWDWFKGQLWIDADSGMPVGVRQFVKTPSVFLKKIAFVRDYEIRNGIAFPSHIQSTVDTRIVAEPNSRSISAISRARIAPVTMPRPTLAPNRTLHLLPCNTHKRRNQSALSKKSTRLDRPGARVIRRS